MITFAIIYWSIILIIGILFSIKAFNGIYKYIIELGRRWILTRILIVLPIRLIVNMILSCLAGIIIFFHVLFFVCISVFIYVFLVWSGDSSSFTYILYCICMLSLFSPIIFIIIKTIYGEYMDFKQKG
jgi:hypothetical protein